MPGSHGALAPLWPLYAAVVALRGKLYDAGWLAVSRLPGAVISVGNLTVGGSGKSPMTALIAETLSRRGRRPGIVSRGYGGSYAGPAAIVSEGSGPLLDAAAVGDEPVMLARQLPGVPIVVSRRRVDGGRLAMERFGCRSLVLDDGYQHRALARDLDLLLLDGPEPFGDGRMLPAGRLREPVAAMARAGALVITRADRASSESLEAIRRAARAHCPTAPVYHATYALAGLVNHAGREAGSLDRLRGARAVCFAGIARPERFFQDVASSGATVADSFPFPDHHPYTAAQLDEIARAAARCSADLVLTTEKDLARLSASATWPDGPPLFGLRARMAVQEREMLDGLIARMIP